MNYGLELAKIMLYLLLVIGLIYLVAYFYRNRFNIGNTGQHIQVIERVYISPKTTLSLVKVGDKVLLLGINERGIDVLEDWHDPDFIDIGNLNLPKKNFKDYLQEFSNLYGRDNDDQES